MNESDLWKTPKWLLEILDFNFDPCPTDPKIDGLSTPWHGKVMCNPPYSEIEKWIFKAKEERQNCESILMILPLWPSRRWCQIVLEEFPVFILTEKLQFEGLFQKVGYATFKTILVKIK